MRYKIRQKLLSWGSHYTIQDEDERDVFLVRGKAISIGDKLSFQDADGRELLYIEQKVWNWRPTYEIQRDGRAIATVKKELFTFFKSKFEVDVPGPNDYLVEGNMLGHEYRVRRKGVGRVAHVSKKFFSLRDHYGVEVIDGEDDLLILATVIVIDQVCHDGGDAPPAV